LFELKGASIRTASHSLKDSVGCSRAQLPQKLRREQVRCMGKMHVSGLQQMKVTVLSWGLSEELREDSTDEHGYITWG